jgi:ribosomal protein S18 acetylase RimI-like enzyme
MTITISAAARSDIDRLCEIYSSAELEKAADESRWFVNCYFDYHHINLAKVRGQIRGACFWRIEGEKCLGLGWIENLWVDGRSRRRGLGERLLRKSLDDMEAFYAKDGIKLRKVALMTQADKASAKKLYERVGFRKATSIDDMYDPGGHDLMYLLDWPQKSHDG